MLMPQNPSWASVYKNEMQEANMLPAFFCNLLVKMVFGEKIRFALIKFQRKHPQKFCNTWFRQNTAKFDETISDKSCGKTCG